MPDLSLSQRGPCPICRKVMGGFIWNDVPMLVLFSLAKAQPVWHHPICQNDAASLRPKPESTALSLKSSSPKGLRCSLYAFSQITDRFCSSILGTW